MADAGHDGNGVVSGPGQPDTFDLARAAAVADMAHVADMPWEAVADLPAVRPFLALDGVRGPPSADAERACAMAAFDAMERAYGERAVARVDHADARTLQSTLTVAWAARGAPSTYGLVDVVTRAYRRRHLTDRGDDAGRPHLRGQRRHHRDADRAGNLPDSRNRHGLAQLGVFADELHPDRPVTRPGPAVPCQRRGTPMARAATAAQAARASVAPLPA